MTGPDNMDINPCRLQWAMWLADFKAAFRMHNLAQDALNWIGVLQQGLKSITEYCMAFFKLKGKLSLANTNSNYMKNCF